MGTTTMKKVTKITRPEEYEPYAREAKRLEALYERLKRAEAALPAAREAVEVRRQEVADAELRAALKDGRDPEVQRLYAALQAAEEAVEAAERSADVLRVAVSEQHKVVGPVAEEATRLIVADAFRRWGELLAEWQEVASAADAVQQALYRAAEAQGRPYGRELSGWRPSAYELQRMVSWTETARELLRASRHDV